MVNYNIKKIAIAIFVVFLIIAVACFKLSAGKPSGMPTLKISYFCRDKKIIESTGFLIKSQDGICAVTFVQYISNGHNNIDTVEWRDAQGKNVVACIKIDGDQPHRVDGPTRCMKVEVVKEMYTSNKLKNHDDIAVLEFDDREAPEINEKVWIATNGSENNGPSFVDGHIIAIVGNGKKIGLQCNNNMIFNESEMGSPVISVKSGKVIGFVEGINVANGKTLIPTIGNKCIQQHIGNGDLSHRFTIEEIF